ncbi:MAG TPA: DUF5711 family protein [Lachnospiraceae bacterium]|nr:DUF5711 family protein [Lachnospiraceae bacterium]
MATIKEEPSLYEKKMKRHKQKVMIAISTIGIVALAVIIFLINSFFHKNYNSYEVEHTTVRQDSNTVKYVSYKDKLLKYSRDGVAVLEPSGKVLWNASYDMRHPQIAICKSYIAIADIGYKQLNVYDGKGNEYPITTTLPIIDVAVAEQGVVAVTVEGEDYNQVLLYYALTGEVLVQTQTGVQDEGYPIDIAISHDAKKMVSDYFVIQGGVIETDVSFYNFSDVGDNKESQLVGGIKKPKIVTQDVEFINNTTVLLCEENGFSVYRMKEIPSEIFSKTYKREIASIFYTDEYVGCILKNEDEKEGNQLLLYNIDGKKEVDRSIKFGYTNVQMSGEDIIFNTENNIVILDTNGNTKFKYTFDREISYVMPVNDRDEYVVIDDQNIEQIRLVEGKDK